MDALIPEKVLRKYLGKEPEDIDLPEEFEELKGSAAELSEEKKKRREELEDVDSSDLSMAFGLDS